MSSLKKINPQDLDLIERYVINLVEDEYDEDEIIESIVNDSQLLGYDGQVLKDVVNKILEKLKVISC